VADRPPDVLFTIGYEGATVGALMTVMQSAGVACLLDVRAVPLSRKPGFSKRQLAAETEARGMCYVHLRDLGTPKLGRAAARAGRTSEMEAIFRAHMATPAAQLGLGAATELVRERPTCLLCFEREPHRCHRNIIAAMLCARTGQRSVDLLI
jgi:uncharacterized protein (DUF488 family)